MSRDINRRASKIIDMALANAGIKKMSRCRRRLSLDFANDSVSDSNLTYDGLTTQSLHAKPLFDSTLGIAELYTNPMKVRLTNEADEQQKYTITQASDLVNISTNLPSGAAGLPECDTTDQPKTTKPVTNTCSTISVLDDFNAIVPVEANIEELPFNENQIEKNAYISMLHDCNALAGQNEEINLIKNKLGKRKSRKDIAYIDYVSDKEDFSTFYGDIDDSDNWSSEGQDISEEDSQTPDRKQKKKKRYAKKGTSENTITEVKSSKNDTQEIVGESARRMKKTNLRKEHSKNKKSGQEYTSKSGVVIPEKKVLPNPCVGKKCGNNCGSLSEERRDSLFKHFWNLEPTRRRDWLVSLSQKESIKRKRTDSDKRTCSFKYFINEGEGRRYVCQKFLASTLNISDKTIYSIIKNATWGCAKDDMRGKCEPPNKTKQSTIENVMKFIKNLPAVPSHYCRQDSSKVYLPQEYKNVSNLYKNYKKYYVDQSIDVVSERIFRKIFQEKFNIGFHIPKKDKCLKCLQFENNDDPEKQKEKQEHETEKEESHNRFKVHKNIHKDDPSTLCASFDLEKVLNTPFSQSMLLYYSRKLAVYNFCVYENGTRRVFCYYWDETNGKRGANEIATILNKYIKAVDARGNVKRLLLYSDCCPGQNRNRTVLAMLHATLQECKYIKTMQMNFLLTGHTYMPVDTAHAIIENKLKNTTVYAPSQWFTVFTTARQEPSPFEVERLSYEDFYKWDSISDKYFKGNLTGKISKIRIMTFKKDRQSVTYKTSMNSAAKTFDVDVQSIKNVSLLPCYRLQIPISKPKYDDLNKLCTSKVIPSCFHHEFVNIPKATNINDTLPESDIEDPDFN